jgi:quercetin dioxygenase-like cupin family protein
VGDGAFLDVELGAVLSDRAERTVRTLHEHELLDVTWSRYEPGELGPGPHVHHRHVDAFYVVEGELEFGVGPDVEPVRAPAGTFVAVPPDVVHTFRNASEASVRWLNFHAPSTGFVAYMRGDRDGFDSHDPPEDGGRSAAEATVARAEGDAVTLGVEPQLAVAEVELEPGAGWEAQESGGVDACFVLRGEIELPGGERARPRTWIFSAAGVRNPGPGSARLLRVRAPGRAA